MQKKNLHTYIKLVTWMLLFLFIFVIFYNASFNEFFYGIETIKSNNSGSISLYFFTTMFPNIVLMIIFIMIGMINAKKKNILKITLIGFILATLFVGVFDIFSMPINYEKIKIEGNTVSMLNYKYAIIKDMIQGKTTTIVTHNVNCYNDYIEYFNEQEQYSYCSRENPQLIRIVNELLIYEDQFKIEYYNNTGIIKSIDEIAKTDYEKLNERVNLIKDNFKYEIEKEIQKQEEEINEERQLNKIKNEIMNNAIGHKIEEIENKLKENEIVDYSIEYISSKLYDIGTVAFVEKRKSPCIYYVIKDNEKEDLVEMPKLKIGMTKDDIIETLQSRELNYEYDTVNWGDHQSGTLHTCSFSAGTLLPKGTVVWFSIDE